MRIDRSPESSNVEDLRGAGPRARGTRVFSGGLSTLLLVLVVALLGGDPQQLLSLLMSSSQVSLDPYQYEQDAQMQSQFSPEQAEEKKFVSAVLGDTEQVWKDIFAEHGWDYVEPKLVLFSGQVMSSCGDADAAMGPFYCPEDQKVYIDLTFYDEMKNRFRAPGDFAQAYVIAHEIGHHVQNLLGISDKVAALRRRVSPEVYNQYSVRLELQADYLAGVWASRAQAMRNILEEGDIEEALRAATAIGDDRLQMQTQGYVVPDSFTHGTSEQRVRWFTKGFKSGKLEDGDTFSVADHLL